VAVATLFDHGGTDNGDQGEPVAGDPVQVTWRDSHGQRQAYTFTGAGQPPSPGHEAALERSGESAVARRVFPYRPHSQGIAHTLWELR
jgi:hypothetical protein